MIPGRDFIDQLAMFRGFGYAPADLRGRRDCRYPTPIPGPVRTKRPPPRQTDCVCFAEALILGACYRAGLPVEWSQDRHDQAILAGYPQGSLASVAAYVDAEIATSAGLLHSDVPPAWTLCQGWRQLDRDPEPDSGHMFIIAASDPVTRRVLLLHASQLRKGVWWGDVAPLSARHATPADLGAADDLPTWDSIVARFSAGLAMARLLITEDLG